MDQAEKAFDDEGLGLLTTEQVQEQVREKVTQNFTGFARAFADVDYARIGVVSKDDFRDVLTKYAFRLSDDQVRSCDVIILPIPLFLVLVSFTTSGIFFSSWCFSSVTSGTCKR